MKILILSDNFPPEKDGGAERIAFNYFNGLKNLSHDVFVMTTASSHHPEQSEAKPRDFVNLHLTDNHIFFLPWPKKYLKFKHFFGLYNLKANKLFKKILKEISPEIVHAHNIHDILGLHLLKLAKKSRAKVFLTAHDCALFHYGKLTEFLPQIDKNQTDQNFNYKVSIWQQLKRYQKSFLPFRKTLIKHYLKYVDKIFSVSEELKKTLEQNNIKNIVVIHNGIDRDKWQTTTEKMTEYKNKFLYSVIPAKAGIPGIQNKTSISTNNPKIIFWGGRLNTLKGGGLLLDALELVVKQSQNLILMIVGKNDKEAEKFLNSAKEKHITAIITGWLTQEKIITAYAASDFVIVPSAYLDPFPTINLEAMACAKPVIGTCLGGTKEIVQDKKTGYIINPYNKETFAEKIITLLNNPELAKQFGEAGYARVKTEFSLDKQLNETINYYEQNYS